MNAKHEISSCLEFDAPMEHDLLKMHPLLQHFLQYFGKGRSLERFGCFQICKGHDVLNHKDDDVQDSEGR